MKKSIIFFFLLSFSIVGAVAQQSADDEFFTKPDYKQIEKSTKDSTSPFHFPKLMQRYQTADSTLTLEEKRHLYYGYIFQPDYKAIDRPKFNDKLSESLLKQNFTNEDYAQILSNADEMLLDDPFSIRALQAQLFVYAQQDNAKAYKATVIKRQNVLDAIVSSGDGISKKTPFYVIRVGHEYDLLGYMGYVFGGENKVMKNQNYLSVRKNKFGIEGLFFNIEPVLEYMSKNR